MRSRLFSLLLLGLGLALLLGCESGLPTRPPAPTTTPWACVPYGTIERPAKTPTATIRGWPTLPATLTPTPPREAPSSTPTASPWLPTCTCRPDEPTLTPSSTPAPTITPLATQPLPYSGGGSSPLALSGQIGMAFPGGIVLDSQGHAHAVWYWWDEDYWQEGKSYYAGQDAAGGWTRRAALARGAAKSKGAASIAVGPDNTLYAVYGDGLGRGVRLFLRSSSDSGTTWTAPEPVTSATSAYPTIQVDAAGVVHILYRRMECAGDPDDEETICVSYQEHIEGWPGVWSAPERPVRGGGDQVHQDMITQVLPDGRNRTWAFISVQYEGVYAAYKDSGGDWSGAVKVGNTPGKSAMNIRGIAFDHDGTSFVYVFWNRYAVSGLETAWSSDGGASWHYQAVTTLGGGDTAPFITSAAPLYDFNTGKLWVLYIHVVWTPRRGFVGVLGVTPGQSDWFPSVPGPDEKAVLEADSSQARSVRVGWRGGLAAGYPVIWEEYISMPEALPQIGVYQAWVFPARFPLLWAEP